MTKKGLGSVSTVRSLGITLLLALFVLFLPVERIYDKFFHHFSLTLIPEGIHPLHFDKKIALYITDFLALSLLAFRRLSFNLLWPFFLCVFLSIVASPYANYPLPYFHLLHLLAPIVLVSFLSEEKEFNIKWILIAVFSISLFEATVGIAQYFHEAPIGLRFLNEPRHIEAMIAIPNQSLWLLDPLFGIIRNAPQVIRATGTLPHPNAYGGFMLFSLLCTYPLAKRFYFAIPFQIFALFLSFSRSALIGWIIATGIYCFYIRRKALFFTVLASAALITALLYQQITYRGTIVQAIGSLDPIRIYYQNLSLKIIQAHPFFGLGYTQYFEQVANYFPDTPPMFTAPHNIFLLLACETGLISLVLFLFFIAQLLWRAISAPKTAYSTAFFALFIAFLFIGCCDFYPIFSQPGRMMFFLTMALLASSITKTKESPVHTFKNYGILSSMQNPSRKEIWKLFDAISPTYDRTNRWLSFGMDQRWRKKMAEFLPPKANLKILDLATGTGDQALALLNSKASIQALTGIDLSSEMLAIANIKLQNRARLIRADAEKLPFQNGHFDAASFSFGIRNVTDPLASLKEIFRVLKPKGRCLILEFSLPPQLFRPLFLFYLRHIMPFIGALFSKKKEAYRYLNETIESFPHGKEFGLLMKAAGFSRIRIVPMAFGGVSLYIGEKM